ncbi:MAG: hypothetical protein QN178_13090 [Armatimonadota bacterium]|nr:hypothetical protein [Armatimonadota bacterium]
MTRWYAVCTAIIAAVVGLAAARATPLRAQSGPQAVITFSVVGTIQDRGGVYYIAFAVGDSLLAGPQPDSSNWTHYVVYRGGRFFFGTVPPSSTQPFSFVSVRPPAPFVYGQVLPDRKALRVSVPLSMLQVGPAPPRRFMVNFVTTDEANRPLDALGMGASDRLGFVTVTVGQDVYVPVRAPRGGTRPDPNFAIAGGEIQLTTP